VADDQKSGCGAECRTHVRDEHGAMRLQQP
jgi:hypothetical protein